MDANIDLTIENGTFEKHSREAVEKYRALYPDYERFGIKIKEVLETAIPKDCPVHRIDARAKDPESVRKKAAKPDRDDGTKPKYPNPLNDITDMTGVRVITYVPDALKEVEDCIRREFNVTWNEDVGETRYEEGRFGYKSIHFLIKLRDNRDQLSDWVAYKDLVAEIQIRTIMQHAWAEMEHDIRYKGPDAPPDLERRFTSLAGMLEIADREFQAIQDRDAAFRLDLETLAQDELVQTQLDIRSGDDFNETLDTETFETDATFDTDGTDNNQLQDANEEKAASPGLARYYIANRRYRDAADVYTRMIEAHPQITTLWSGRAKALFLAGDRNKALEDIEFVLSKLPNDPGAIYLKSQLETGPVERRLADPEASRSLSIRGRESLIEGDGEKAFDYYSRSQEDGANFFFSQLNKAMACILIKDPGGAIYFLDQLRIYPDPNPIRVTVLALRAISACLLKTGAASGWNSLRDEFEKCPQYRFDQSVLPDLEVGLQKRDGVISDCIQRIFDHLRQGSENRDAVVDDAVQ